MISIQNLSKSYSGHKVVGIDNLFIEQGIHWFKGKNGSGKTTFFRVLAGMLPFEGEISINNISIRKNPINYRFAINYGEAEPIYPIFLTANDLISFVATTKKASKNQITDLIERLGIGSFLHQNTGTFSSGMLKKLSVALAFLGNPKVIVLDEPLITIDDQTVTEVYKMVGEQHANGISFLLSSHQDFRFEQLPISNTFLVQNQTIQLI